MEKQENFVKTEMISSGEQLVCQPRPGHMKLIPPLCDVPHHSPSSQSSYSIEYLRNLTVTQFFRIGMNFSNEFLCRS